MANKDKQRFSTLLVIREMDIKTTMRHHFVPTRMAVKKKKKQTRKYHVLANI